MTLLAKNLTTLTIDVTVYYSKKEAKLYIKQQLDKLLDLLTLII